MKLIHVSDIHIHVDPILDADPVENFARCLDHIVHHNADADRIVVTGDLTHNGAGWSYRMLRQMLDASGLSGDRAPRLLIGNHDSRERFVEAFPEMPRDRNGFVQWSEETPAGTFLYLDTVEAGTHAGRYCQERLDWLDRELQEAAAVGDRAYLFMHHNPLPVEVANADTIGLEDGEAFRALLSRHAATIAHIFFGHCHYTLSGSVAGIPFSAPRSTNHPCWPEFSGDPRRMGYGVQSPSYNVAFLNGRDTVVHTIDYTLEDDVRWLGTEDNGWIAEDDALAG